VTIEILIAVLVALAGVDAPLETTIADAAAVAACESGDRQADGTAAPGSYRWDAENPVSSASGAFQFIDGTWTWTLELAGLPPLWDRAVDAPPIVQFAAFAVLWDGRAGAQHWAPSRSCWADAL